MLMRREAERLTYHKRFMNVTLSQKDTIKLNPLCIGPVMWRRISISDKKNGPIFKAKLFYVSHRNNSKIYFPSKVRKALFALMA